MLSSYPINSGKELFTEMRSLQRSYVTFSSNGWQFEISSVVEATRTVHASPRIGFHYAAQKTNQDLFFPAALYGRAADAKMVQEDGKPKYQCRTFLSVSDTNMD